MKKKKIVKISLIVLISIILTVSLSFGIFAIVKNSDTAKHNFDDALPDKSKVILFIGDGMGENHVEIAKTYLERNVSFESFNYIGYVTTASKELFSPTDSAAAATALSTGQKVFNGAIAREDGKNITTISELAKLDGKGVGIVTTDSLTGATPACFSAHANNRKDTKDIIESQLISNVDLFLGAGYGTYEQYKSQFESKGYLFTNDFSKLTLSESKIFGTFESIANVDGTNEKPTLPQLVEFAEDFMEAKYPNGYFLMVEGAHIDKMSHKNQIVDMIEYFSEFEKSISYTKKRFTSDNQMALIVTADHETGNLQKFNGTKEDIDNSLYQSSGHSPQNVKYYFHLCGKNQPFIHMPDNIDNTDIFKICNTLLIAKTRSSYTEERVFLNNKCGQIKFL